MLLLEQHAFNFAKTASEILSLDTLNNATMATRSATMAALHVQSTMITHVLESVLMSVLTSVGTELLIQQAHM